MLTPDLLARIPTPLLSDPQDCDAWLYPLLSMPEPEPDYTQLQRDWDRFVTFGDFTAEPPVAIEEVLPTHLQLPSPSSRSVTPSPIVPVLQSVPMRRHVTGSPEVIAPYPPPLTIIEQDIAPLARSGVRERTRRRVREQHLHRTAEGREILRLTGHAWYRAPSGLAVTQYPPHANWWKCNDVANYLNWLDRDIRVHRSQICRLIAVENMAALNEVLNEQGYASIGVTEPPQHFLLSLYGMGERQRDIPVFLRTGYLTRTHGILARRRRRAARMQIEEGTHAGNARDANRETDEISGTSA